MFETTLNPLQDSFIRVVQEEVKPTLGCTEPISLALAAAVASPELDGAVEHIDAWTSPNLMKNGMGVTVPGTGVVGLPVATALGALEGNTRTGLEVLKDALLQVIAGAKAVLSAGKVAAMLQEPCEDILFSRTGVYSAEGWVCVVTVGGYTNIVHIGANKGVMLTTKQNAQEEEQESLLAVLSHASLEEVLTFVNAVPSKLIRSILDAAKLNGVLSQEGLYGNWGLYVGTMLEEQCARGSLANDLSTSILIRTNTASDVRMGGATLPAISSSGSGNQGITAAIPVTMAAEYFGTDEEELACALMLSHLSVTYIHHQPPRLSALCTTTMAAMGAVARMAWIVDSCYNTTAVAISSMIGGVSGMICDGTPNSCTMKISVSVSAAWKAVLMVLDDTAVTGNKGIVVHNVEQSIANLCALACCPMQETDKQVIEIMASKTH